MWNGRTQYGIYIYQTQQDSLIGASKEITIEDV